MDPWEAGLQLWALRMMGPGLSLGCYQPFHAFEQIRERYPFHNTLSVTCWEIITRNVPRYTVYAVNGILKVYVMYDLYNSMQWS